IPVWEPPKTSRVYLHPLHSERLISFYPDLKITDLDLCEIPYHYNQKGFGVHLLAGSEPGDCDMEKTIWKKPENGLPVYTVYNTDPENGCALTVTAFCDTARVPLTYCEVTVTNTNNYRVDGTLGLLPRFAELDHYLTGLHDTGYEPYNPNVGQWYLCWQNPFAPTETDGLTAVCADGYGWMRILETEHLAVRWVSRKEQLHRFRAHDYYRLDYTLPAGGTAAVRFVLRRGDMVPVKPYGEALAETTAFWRAIQAKVTLLPADEGKITEDMFRQNLTVMLQMLQHYEKTKDPDFVFARQGDVGRFIWVWEAAHFLTVLDRVGLSEYVTDAYRMFFDNWQLQEGDEAGKLANPWVNWDNTNGSAIWGTCYHLLTRKDPALFEEFRPKLNLALQYIQYRRSLAREGEVQGLFSSGCASDWGEVGQHWTYTDAVNVYGLSYMVKCYEQFGASEAGYVREVYEDHRDVVMSVLRKFEAEHAGEKSYNMPHILGVPFEESYNHCFYTDGCPYLVKLGILDPNTELFEQMERFYREIGFLDDEHGLAGRMTNDACGADGLYGNVYYTGVAEVMWLEAWMRRGERDKVDRYARGMLRYNVTPEFIVSERYSSVDPWFTPWQPNASGAGRLCQFLLDYCGEKEKE
ncbi:MAG: hypothetical protein ACI4V1_02035, partial [Eubacteriales bacterium]